MLVAIPTAISDGSTSGQVSVMIGLAGDMHVSDGDYILGHVHVSNDNDNNDNNDNHNNNHNNNHHNNHHNNNNNIPTLAEIG